MRNEMTMSRILRWTALASVAAAGAACGGKHYLAQYEFSEKTLSLAYIDPPSPELLHGWLHVNADDNAVQAVVRAGAGVAKEIEARRARARLDSAASMVDVPGRLAERTLERASRYLGTTPVGPGQTSDFVLEIHMRRFGLDARSNSAAYLFTRAEAVLIDRRTGREIWSEEVHGSDRMTPFAIGTRSVPSSIFTAATLHMVTVEEFQQALDQLVTYTSNLITSELRDKLRDVRDR